MEAIRTHFGGERQKPLLLEAAESQLRRAIREAKFAENFWRDECQFNDADYSDTSDNYQAFQEAKLLVKRWADRVAELGGDPREVRA